jgi:hypothetical protein
MKLKLQISLFIFFVSIISFFSCKTSYNSRFYVYIPKLANDSSEYVGNYNDQSIFIENDSILRFGIRYGGLGASKSVKYRKKDNYITVDSLDVGGFANKGFGYSFEYYKDSIVSEKANDLYLSRKYLNKLDKKLKKEAKVYFIIDNKKYKITSYNIKRIYKRINISEYDIIQPDKDEAKKLYGINEKHTTLKFSKKK